jgi:SAM-dependent methyltransferase
MRAMVHVLSIELFGASTPIERFAERKDIRGIGMSDWPGYADRLAEKLDYVNTYYHKDPRLDICEPDPGRFGTLDFILSSDVFEHLPPPVDIAFENVRKLLKPSGVLVFSVPYKPSGRTDEHFPDLFDFRLEKRESDIELHNMTRDGKRQVFRELVFHGGEGMTLEMRTFSRHDLVGHFTRAGFVSPRIYSEEIAEHGIVWDHQWSLPMSARPAQR